MPIKHNLRLKQMLITLVRMIKIQDTSISDEFFVRGDVKTGMETLPPEYCWHLLGSSHHSITIAPWMDAVTVPVIFSDLFSTLASILRYIYEQTAQIQGQ